ncbi:substrate-binding domain-containing protein [Cellulophaga sp. HaHaR_3_176]|uniref:substrate-binding domain-containing protein n=1 Tax=Cellulophaga sp. HaHaR_3_176 TaxID=1942464 RepID=UPI001C1FDC71|nr:substrate-binding domain-containing protein [Cellulophaga sp. HaHaR_3_176]QWX82820.1 substrate-binding domain-containing protein [Cellulophaga sp. HaHaR_3_176]
MVTINDIAKEAKVSAGTVDRVIHNRGGVSKKTEAKIKLIIEKHDFQINALASSLALNKRVQIAVLIPDYDTENTFWKSPTMGVLKAKDEVKKIGANVACFNFNQFDEASYVHQLKKIITSQPDAILLAPLFGSATRVLTKELDQKEIPYLFLNINLEGCNNISFIGQDSYMSGFLAGKLMRLSLEGKSTIAIMQTRINLDNNHAIYNRIKGFEDYFPTNRAPINVINVNVIDLDNTKELKEKLETMFIENPSIKGVYVPNSRVFTFANAISSTKINDLVLIGFDGTDKNVMCLENEKVAFLISQQPFKEAYEAIKLIVDFLVDKKELDERIYSPIEILTKENVSFSKHNK